MESSCAYWRFLNPLATQGPKIYEKVSRATTLSPKLQTCRPLAGFEISKAVHLGCQSGRDLTDAKLSQDAQKFKSTEVSM